MHICFICNEYPPGRHGGVGSFTQTLGRALVRGGHRVSAIGLYSVDQAIEENDQGVAVIRLPHSNLRGGGFFLNVQRVENEIERLNRRQPIDVLDGPEDAYGNIHLDGIGAKVIRMNGGHHFFTTTLGERPRWLRGRQERRSFARADRLCAVSRFVAERTRALLRLGDRPIEILPNPVDTVRFRPRPEIAEEDGLIIFAGTQCEKKGVRQLVEAMPRIAAEAPHTRLLIVGRDSVDPLTGESFKSRLERAIAPELKGRIEFVEFVENHLLPDVLAQASVCVYPSHMEAQGIVIIEGLAMGKAVVTGHTGPGPELVEDGVSGLLCDPHNPDSIAEQVIRALNNQPLRERLGREARLRAVHKFSVEALVGQNEDFYRRCITQS
ncbi:MAG: glycosyltransferase family 4 protein [Blastocatellia bacterium]